MSKFFVCHEPQCTAVVLNPYRHHLDVHSHELSKEAIVCLRQKASKREVEILKETQKSTKSLATKIKQPVLHSQKTEVHKPRKFGENCIGKQGKKRTLDIPAFNLSTANSIEKQSKKRTLDIPTSNLSAATSIEKQSKKRTLDIPTSNLSAAISTECSAKINSVGATPLVKRSGQEIIKSSLSCKKLTKPIHRTISKPELSDVTSKINMKTSSGVQMKVSTNYPCNAGNLHLKQRKCKTINNFVQPIAQNTIKKSPSKRQQTKAPYKSKLCKIADVELLTNREIIPIEDLTDSFDQGSVAVMGAETKLESVHHHTDISNLETKKENFPGTFTDLHTSSNTKHVLPTKMMNSTVNTQNQMDDSQCVDSDIVVRDAQVTSLAEKGKIMKEYHSSAGHTLQKGVKIESTCNVKSEIVFITDENISVQFPPPKSVEEKLSPRKQITQLHSSLNSNMDLTRPSASQLHCSSQLSPLNIARASKRPTVFRTSEHTDSPTASIIKCEKPAPANSASPTQLAQNIRVDFPPKNILAMDCILISPAKVHYEETKPAHRNLVSCLQEQTKNPALPGIYDLPKTVLSGELCSTTATNSFDKLNQQPLTGTSGRSDLQTKLDEICSSTSVRKKQCNNIFSPNSTIPSKMFSKQLDYRNPPTSVLSHPIHETNGEDCSESTINANPNNQLKSKSFHFNDKISSEEIEQLQDDTSFTSSPVGHIIESSRTFSRPNHLKENMLDHRRSATGQTAFTQSGKSNSADYTPNAKSHQNTLCIREIVDAVSSTTSTHTKGLLVSLSWDEIMYRFLMSPYAIRHLSSCIDSETNNVTISDVDAGNVQNVLILLLLKSCGDLSLLCLLTVFDILGAQNIKGSCYQVLHQSTHKTVMLNSSELNYLKLFIKNVRPVLSQDSYGCLFTINCNPFTETTLRQALIDCWAKTEIDLDVSILWRHVQETSVDSESASDQSQNTNISSTSAIQDSAIPLLIL